MWSTLIATHALVGFGKLAYLVSMQPVLYWQNTILLRNMSLYDLVSNTKPYMIASYTLSQTTNIGVKKIKIQILMQESCLHHIKGSHKDLNS
ncbi:hypothetical protein Pfo_007042 [Paulownia fortunei]|nr:hypothetical protein Pfo_007042 [Paulownia fortunei]